MTPDEIRHRAVEAATQAAWGVYWRTLTPLQEQRARGDMARAITAYEAAMWQHIETAPMDGMRVLFFAPAAGSEYPASTQRFDRWHKGAWWQMRPGQPYTHWRPLPAGPGDGT